MAEKILIIDDDIDTTRLVCLMFQNLGYQTVVANDGRQGLVKTSKEAPDLVLLDIMMPDMDGYEVARRLRNNPETTRIPILMFTAKSQADDKIIGYDAGADDYLTKPTHPSQLQAHVKALLKRSPKAETEQTTPQLSSSKNNEKKSSTRRGKKNLADNLVRARFATWFENPPSNDVKE
jgi:DNA-binding response OmpR family regulator